MLLNGFIFAKYKRYLDTEPWHWFEMAYELNHQSYARYFYPCDVILLLLNSVQFELRNIFFLTESGATDDILRLTNDETSHFAAKGYWNTIVAKYQFWWREAGDVDKPTFLLIRERFSVEEIAIFWRKIPYTRYLIVIVIEKTEGKERKITITRHL